MASEELLKICVKLIPEIKTTVEGYGVPKTIEDVQNLIRFHFQQLVKNAEKRPHYRFTLYGETNCILRLFPSYTHEQIYEKLELFANFINRVQIVLRLLLNEQKQSYLPQNYLNFQENNKNNNRGSGFGNNNNNFMEPRPSTSANSTKDLVDSIMSDAVAELFPNELLQRHNSNNNNNNFSFSECAKIPSTSKIKDELISENGNYGFKSELSLPSLPPPLTTTTNCDNDRIRDSLTFNGDLTPIDNCFPTPTIEEYNILSNWNSQSDNPNVDNNLNQDKNNENMKEESNSLVTTTSGNFKTEPISSSFGTIEIVDDDGNDSYDSEKTILDTTDDISEIDDDVKLAGASINVVNLKRKIGNMHNGMINNSVDLTETKNGDMNDNNNLRKENEEEFYDDNLINYLCGIFTDISKAYIKSICRNKTMNEQNVDFLTAFILDNSTVAPKRQKKEPSPEPAISIDEQFDLVKEILPDCDPDYLRTLCEEYAGRSQELRERIDMLMDSKQYPSIKEYQRRQQLSAQQKQYTSEFSVENFLKVIPNPNDFFSNPQRTVEVNSKAAHYAIGTLRNIFNKIQVKYIQQIFAKNKQQFKATYDELKELESKIKNRDTVACGYFLRTARKPMLLQMIDNIPLLQEIAYCVHKNEINEYFEEQKRLEEAEMEEARKKGLMQTCGCCYNDDVLPRLIYKCNNGCSFCKECLVKSCEINWGEGKLSFPCLNDCQSEFSLLTLQSVLKPDLFSKIARKKAVEEVKSAGIEDLEQCPFCDFATIPPEGDKLFTCLNPECMKQSCRTCKEPNHIPLRCDEVEKDADVQARTYVENKMTEALLRECYKCKRKFVKSDGCNKMTCICGAKMCYICKQPVTDYKHFNGEGGDRFDLCPLFSDTEALHKNDILQTAQEAKAQVGTQLKYDPTKDLNKFYKASKRPKHNIPGINLNHHRHNHQRRHGHHHRHLHLHDNLNPDLLDPRGVLLLQNIEQELLDYHRRRQRR